MIVVEDNVLTAEETDTIKYEVLGSSFPWYYWDWAVDTAEHPCPFFGHVIVVRPEDSPVSESFVNSEWYDFFYPIVNETLKGMELLKEDAKIIRMCVNDTNTWPFENSGIHRDHENIEHWNVILYLTDSTGDTIIYNDKFEELRRESPVAGRMVVWDGLPLRHAQQFKKSGDERRVVLVATVEKED